MLGLREGWVGERGWVAAGWVGVASSACRVVKDIVGSCLYV